MCIAGLAFLLALPAYSGGPITQTDLLNRMIDLDRLYEPAPPGERPFLFSAPAGASGKTTDDGWTILADIAGPGVIQSIWTGTSDGQLRIVTDDQPAVDGSWADFYSGGIDPFGAPICYFTSGQAGGNCWMPIGFGKSCKVLSKGNAGAYAIGGTMFSAGTQVERFDGRLDAAALEALERISKVFQRGLSEKELLRGRKIMPVAVNEELKSKAKATISIDQPSIIRALYVSMTDPHAPREEYAHHHLVLRVYYDGSDEADVEAPLCDFFGSGFDRTPYKSSVMGTDLINLDIPTDNMNEGWFMYSYFPMPITKSARIEIENLNSRKVGVTIWARVDRAAPPAGALRFNARYRWYPAAKPGDLLLAELHGQGRIVGSVLLADCPRPGAWWGGGAVRLAIDGAAGALSAPDAAAWYATLPAFEPKAHAFTGVTLHTLFGKYSAYRWFVGDSLSFHNGARLVLRNEQAGGEKDVDFGHVLHWYGEPAARATFKPLKAADFEVSGLRIPGAIEIEGTLDGKDWGSLLRQAHVPGIELSGQAAVNITTTGKVISTIQVPSEGDYLLQVRMVPGRSFKPIAFFDPNGTKLKELAWEQTETYIWDVGRVHLSKGPNKLGIQCTEKASIDCWILQPAKGEKTAP